MSNSDFEDRLSRIRAGAEPQSSAPSGGQAQRGIRYGRLALGALAMSAGGQMTRVANTSYEWVRDQYGIPAAAGLGLGGFALLIVGAVLLISAVLPARRLNRTEAGAAQQSSAPSGGKGKRGIRVGRLALGALAMSAGGLMIKITNTNYEWVRDQYGIPAAAGLGLGGFALLIFGVVLLISAALPTRSTSPAPSSSLSYPITAARTPAQISVGARVIFSLLGLILGAVACFYMYIASASALLDIARQIDTETAKKMAIGSALMAFILAFVALLIGFIGLFVRRLPMLRVPVFFLLGAMVLYTSFQTLRIHPSNWPTFMAEFTKSFKD